MPNADTAAAQLQPSRFFAHTALLMAVLVFLSFPLTYYLPVLARSQHFQLLIQIHGLACFAWIALLAPARWTLKLPLSNPLIVALLACLLITVPFLIALALHDLRALGRVHAATWTAVAVVLPLQLSSPWVARSAWWNGIAPALLGSS